MRPGSCAVNTMPSNPGSVPGSRSLSSSTVWNPVAAMSGNLLAAFGAESGAAFGAESRGLGGLPEADHVALGVGDVGGEAHRADRRLAHDGRATELTDPLQGDVDALHVHDDHRPGCG